MRGRKWLDVGSWQSCLYLDLSQKQEDMNVLEGTLKPRRKGRNRVSVLPRADRHPDAVLAAVYQ